MVKHRSEPAGAQISIDDQHALLGKLRVAQAQIHGCKTLAFARQRARDRDGFEAAFCLGAHKSRAQSPVRLQCSP